MFKLGRRVALAVGLATLILFDAALFLFPEGWLETVRENAFDIVLSVDPNALLRPLPSEVHARWYDQMERHANLRQLREPAITVTYMWNRLTMATYPLAYSGTTALTSWSQIEAQALSWQHLREAVELALKVSICNSQEARQKKQDRAQV